MASFAVVNGLKYSSLYNIIPNIRPHHAWALYNTLEIILRLVQKMSTTRRKRNRTASDGTTLSPDGGSFDEVIPTAKESKMIEGNWQVNGEVTGSNLSRNTLRR